MNEAKPEMRTWGMAGGVLVALAVIVGAGQLRHHRQQATLSADRLAKAWRV